MYRRGHWTLIALLLIISATVVGAETLAVAVRLEWAPEEEPATAELLSDVEEGAMDALFARGHIVFDIDEPDTSEDSWYRAIATARSGGATSLIVVDVRFHLVPVRGVLPQLARVAVVDLERAASRPLGEVAADELPGAQRQTAEALSLSVGREAAVRALAEILEGPTTW